MLTEAERNFLFYSHDLLTVQFWVRLGLMKYLLGYMILAEIAKKSVSSIYFRGSDGHFHEGWVNTVGAGSAITSITNCSLYDVDMGDGSGTVSVFQSRFAVDFYTPSGSYVDTIPAGYFISTKDGLAGESHKTWMHIHSYGESGPKFVDGFINIGFTSMMFESFPLIGTLK